MAYVGSSVSGMLDRTLVAGNGRYTADLSAPGMGFMAVVRSTYAHARVVRIDTTAARTHPGVRIVATGADVRDWSEPIPHTLNPAALGGHTADVHCLATDRVRYVGEPVAALVADTPHVAAEAAALVDVEYEELPVVTDVEAGLAADAPLLYPEWETNEMLHGRYAGGDVAQAFADADHAVEGRLHIHRHTAAPLEPRAVLAEYDDRTDSLKVWVSTQTPHPLRTTLARTSKRGWRPTPRSSTRSGIPTRCCTAAMPAATSHRRLPTPTTPWKDACTSIAIPRRRWSRARCWPNTRTGPTA